MAGMNSTHTYHRFLSIDLMKEFTICETFSRPETPYKIVLNQPRAYGCMVGNFLIKQNLLLPGANIMEIGGGYGNLMHGLMSSHADLVHKIFMVDLSRKLLHRQNATLRPWKDIISFIHADIHELMDAITRMDLIIINEVIGDLDTMTDVDPSDIPQEARSLIETYGLDFPKSETFHLNIGAIKLIETLCRKGIPVFIAEHSSDPIIPQDMPFLSRGLVLNSFPRKIGLYKHDEYTIRFSHLVQVANKLGKETKTGALIDLLDIKKSPAMRSIFTSRACATEKQEIIYEFLDHIREYRWLIIR
jgi:hypothetical protein